MAEKHLHVVIGYRADNSPPYYAWQVLTELGDIWYSSNIPYDTAEATWSAAKAYMNQHGHWPKGE